MAAGGELVEDQVMPGAVALAAARALLRVDTREEAAAVLHSAVRDLGGRVVPADGDPTALDVSLGVGERCTAVPDDPAPEVAARLASTLPALVRDAQAAATRCDRYLRQATRARMDALTGLAGRGEIDTRLARASGDDVVCLMDLDGFKTLNDTRGHAAGDRALRRFGSLLRASVRDSDFVGRYGGDEFLLIFSGIPPAVAVERMGDLVRAWAEQGPGVGVSVGLAEVGDGGPQIAAAAADRALYRAKRSGGGGVQVAVEGDYQPQA